VGEYITFDGLSPLSEERKKNGHANRGSSRTLAWQRELGCGAT